MGNRFTRWMLHDGENVASKILVGVLVIVLSAAVIGGFGLAVSAVLGGDDDAAEPKTTTTATTTAVSSQTTSEPVVIDVVTTEDRLPSTSSTEQAVSTSTATEPSSPPSTSVPNTIPEAMEPEVCGGVNVLTPADPLPLASREARDDANCPIWNGEIAVAGKIDEYVLDLVEGQRVSLMTNLPCTGFAYAAYAPDGSQIVTDTSNCQLQGTSFDAVGGAGPYRVTVFSTEERTGDYDISFADITVPSATAASRPTASTCQIPYHSPTTVPVEAAPAAIDPDTLCPVWNGAIAVAGEVDEYVLDLVDGQRVSVMISLPCTDFAFTTFAPDGSQIMTDTSSCQSPQGRSFDAAGGPGSYRVQVYGTTERIGEYQIAFADITAPNSTAATEPTASTCQVPFYSPTTAPVEALRATIDPETSCPVWDGSIAVVGEVDEFALDLPDGARVSLSASLPCTGFGYSVYGPDGSEIVADTSRCREQGTSFDAVSGAGTYRVQVYSTEERVGEYGLSFSVI